MKKLRPDSDLQKACGSAAVMTRVHDDGPLSLFIDEVGMPQLADGASAAKGVVLSTEPATHHRSLKPGYEHADLASWLGRTAHTDARVMAWSKQGAAYREAVRYADKVLVVWGGNNARDLQTIAMRFAGEADAKRFFESFSNVLPGGFALTSPWHVDGRGAVSRGYWKGMIKDPHSAVGHVLDERVHWLIRSSKGVVEERDQRCKSAAEAGALLSRWELEWYRSGGRPYEIEWLESLSTRSETSVRDFLEREKDRPEFVTFARALLTEAGFETGALSTTPDALLEQVNVLPATHWLRVGERLEPRLRHEVQNKPGISIEFDRVHRVVAIIDASRGGCRVKVTRAPTEAKALASWAKTMKKFGLA